MSSYPYQICYPSDTVDASWDTRNDSYTSPSQQVEAHEKEILSVAFSPSSETLLLTGSSDKVSIPDLIQSFSEILIISRSRGPPIMPHSTPGHIFRRSPSGTHGYSKRRCTASITTMTKCSTYPGRRPTRQSSRPPLPTGVWQSGTLHRSGWSRHQMTRKTGPQSCCLYMVDIPHGPAM